VYVALDEPDGVAGVAAIRNADPSLQEEIMECESTGIFG
jgi:serine/threonine-protein kinase ATR